jgi:hypothetical protein
MGSRPAGRAASRPAACPCGPATPRQPLEPLYDGPYRVLARSLDCFSIQVGNKTDTLSTSCLKHCLESWRCQRSLATEDDPLGRPKRSLSTGRPWSCRRHAWQSLRPLHHHPCLCLRRPLRGHQHHLGWGPEPFFSPQCQGFFVRPGPSRAQRPATQTGRPQRDRQLPVRLDM